MVLAHNINEKARTKDIHILQNITFDTMLLSTKTLQGLQNSGFHRPSPVQLHGIPMGKCGFDLLLEAKSGTGKTAVFTVIALEKIDTSMGLQAVILSPTREIAYQDCDVIKQIGSAYTGLRVEVVMGGLPVKDDIEKFSKNNVHIVVGSPGRLKHLMQDRHINVSAVRLFVLDEADKLMEKSFLGDIKYIYSNLPKQKQVVLASATYPESCKEFLKQFLRGAQHVCPENNSVLLGVNQKITYVKHNSNIVRQTQMRFDELVKILSNIPFKQCLIFSNYQVRVADLHRSLKKGDWPVEMLHGQQGQTDRLGALKTLQEYKCRILISTDLASRGIDASNIDLVINFEPPLEWQTYLHRIGRAGRFGSYGTAITIVSEGIEKGKFMSMFESLNTSVTLTCLWDNNNECHKDKDKLTKDKEEKVSASVNCDSSKIDKVIGTIPNSTNEHTKETSDSSPKAIQEEIETLQNIINKPYDLLLTTCDSKVEIESFDDLIQSYENHNLTDTKENYEYKCIKLPKASNENSECLSNAPSTPKHEEKLINLKDEHTNTTYTKSLDSLPKVDEIEASSNKKYLEHESFADADFERLGLPTEFSSFKNKNLKLTYKTTKEENEKRSRKKDKKKNQNYITNDKFSKSSEPFEDKNYKSKYKENRKEISSTYKVMSEGRRVATSDVNNYNNSYQNWYRQLKIRTKQLELALYIDEMSNIS